MKSAQKFFLFSLIMLSVFSVKAEIYDQLNKYNRGPLDQSYLHDLPQPTNENLRYLLPAEFWSNYKKYLIKGAVLSFKTQKIVEEEVVDTNIRINFYSNSNLSGKVVFSFQDNKVFVGDSVICSYVELDQNQTAKTYFNCGSFYCQQENSENSIILNNYKGLNFELLEVGKVGLDKLKTCSYPFVSYSENQEDGLEKVFVQLLTVNNGVGTIELGGVKYYGDLRGCLKSKECNLVTKTFSDYELSWINLKFVKSQKSYEPLNYLIENLKPCVDKRNIKCVSSFFVTNDEFYQKKEVPFTHALTKVDNELLKDLGECLSYERLLPFGGRMKTNGGKICILFDGQGVGNKKFKLTTVTLPDAYKEESQEVRVNYEVSKL